MTRTDGVLWRERIWLAREEAVAQAMKCGREPMMFVPVPPASRKYFEYLEFLERMMLKIYAAPRWVTKPDGRMRPEHHMLRGPNKGGQ